MVVFTIDSWPGFLLLMLMMLISRVCGVYFCMYLYCHVTNIIWYMLHR